MTIHWGNLLTVFTVSLGSTVVLTVLVATALLGLSARAPRVVRAGGPGRHTGLSAGTGTALAAACLSGAAGIVLFGLWTMIAR